MMTNRNAGKEVSAKLEIRMTKSEEMTNSEARTFTLRIRILQFGFVSNFGLLDLRRAFDEGGRISDFDADPSFGPRGYF